MSNMSLLEKREIQLSVKVSKRVANKLKELKELNGLSANDVFALMAQEMLNSLIEQAKKEANDKQ